MNQPQIKTMRDALIEKIYHRMNKNEKIFFLSADMGAPRLDKLRNDFKDRFINVGIAEQNLINVATGLALEGFAVYAYAIAGFLTMRAYEQIRTNLALLSQHREINVNLVGVGAGASYDMAGPSHHCLEDLSIVRTLPNIILCSPCDWFAAGEFVDFSINTKKPKYLRLDGKSLAQVYHREQDVNFERGFSELVKGDDVCLVSTGYMTHVALKIAEKLQNSRKSIGVLDVFTLNPIGEGAVFEVLKKYKTIITMEEAFINRGGLDCLISNIFRRQNFDVRLKSFGFEDKYSFKSGDRDCLAAMNHACEKDIISVIAE